MEEFFLPYLDVSAYIADFRVYDDNLYILDWRISGVHVISLKEYWLVGRCPRGFIPIRSSGTRKTTAACPQISSRLLFHTLLEATFIFYRNFFKRVTDFLDEMYLWT